MDSFTLRWSWCEECRFPSDLMHTPACSKYVSGLLRGTNSPGLLARRINTKQEELLEMYNDMTVKAFEDAQANSKDPRTMTQEEYGQVARTWIVMLGVTTDPQGFLRPDYLTAWMDAADSFAALAKEQYNERYNVVN